MPIMSNKEAVPTRKADTKHNRVDLQPIPVEALAAESM